MNLAPKNSSSLRKIIKNKKFSIDDVINDILIVKAGASIPTDVLLFEGHGVIDESSLTGELFLVIKPLPNCN